MDQFHMRNLLTVFTVLCFLAPVADAEFVIDAFNQGRGISGSVPPGTINGGVSLGSSAVDNLNQGIAGTRTATVTGFGTVWREGGYINSPSNFQNLAARSQVLQNTNGAGSLTLDYNFSSDFDFSSHGSNTLIFDLFQNVTPGAAWNYVIQIADGLSTASISGALQGGLVLTLKQEDFGTPAFASTIDRISLTVSGPNGGVVNRTNVGAGARILAVPEPSSIALLGLTGLGGVIVARRRRQNGTTDMKA